MNSSDDCSIEGNIRLALAQGCVQEALEWLDCLEDDSLKRELKETIREYEFGR